MTFRGVYLAGALLVFAGAIFKLQHWPNGPVLFIIGLIVGIFGYEMEIRRLKKMIKELETDQK